MPRLKLHDFKRYYTIGELATRFKIQTSHLRFLESELGMNIRRNRKGWRAYTLQQAHLLSAFIYLTNSFGFTIRGAKNYLEL